MEEDNAFEKYREAVQSWIGFVATKEGLIGFLEGMLISVVISFLFYKSLWGMLSTILIVPFWMYLYRKNIDDNNQALLNQEFKEYMLIVANSLQTGYSIESALIAGEAELNKMFADESLLSDYVHAMNSKIKMNFSAEKAFKEMAEEINIEEAVELSDILEFAKRGGGDYGANIKNAAIKIESRLSIKTEINTLIAEKKLELKVMSFMPIGIIAYIVLTSEEFVAPMYEQLTGRVVMTVCLLLYMAFILLGEKLIEINV